MPTLLLVMTASGTTIDDKVGIMTSLGFHTNVSRRTHGAKMTSLWRQIEVANN